jgi:hypothetical protein
VELITQGLEISLFLESLGQSFLKEVTIHDFLGGNVVEPILVPSKKSVRETFNHGILMLVIGFHTTQENIHVIYSFNKVFP